MAKKQRKLKKYEKVNLAVAWYKSEQWGRLRKISTDPDRLEETYGEWQIIAERVMKDFTARGVSPVKVLVDVDELLAWCKERGLPVDGESRSRFAAWLFREKEKAEKQSRK